MAITLADGGGALLESQSLGNRGRSISAGLRLTCSASQVSGQPGLHSKLHLKSRKTATAKTKLPNMTLSRGIPGLVAFGSVPDLSSGKRQFKRIGGYGLGEATVPGLFCSISVLSCDPAPDEKEDAWFEGAVHQSEGGAAGMAGLAPWHPLCRDRRQHSAPLGSQPCWWVCLAGLAFFH